MEKKRILVLTDHMPWGHRSIAKAIYMSLREREGVEVMYAEVKAEIGAVNDVYAFICRYMPVSHRLFHKLAVKFAGRPEIYKEISMRSLPGLRKVVERYKPDLVISAYFLHTHCLAEWRELENKKFKLWTVVADPRSIAPVSFIVKADLNLVYDELGIKVGEAIGVPREKMLITGWWTRKEMYLEYDKAKSKRKLGFNDDRPVVFIGGGSLGTNALIGMLPALMMIRKKIGIVVNTGVDKFAYNLVEEYIRLYKKIKKSDETVIVKNMGWIDNMAEVLSACDLVFGKAGPNFLFDVVARRLPFVAITHVGGQEDGNIDLIKDKKLGWDREGEGQAAEMLLEFSENPEKFKNKFKESIEIEAKQNQKAMEIIWEKIKDIPPKALLQ